MADHFRHGQHPPAYDKDPHAGPSNNRNHVGQTCPTLSFQDRVRSLHSRAFARLDELAAEVQIDFECSAKDEAARDVGKVRILPHLPNSS